MNVFMTVIAIMFIGCGIGYSYAKSGTVLKNCMFGMLASIFIMCYTNYMWTTLIQQMLGAK